MAGLVYTVSKTHVVGDEREVRGTVAFDASYPTGGEAFSKSAIGLPATIADIRFDPSAGYVPVYDYANDKVLVYWGDNNNASDGPLVEVASTTDLSALTAVRFTARGA
jgi:hypothetical protein